MSVFWKTSTTETQHTMTLILRQDAAWGQLRLSCDLLPKRTCYTTPVLKRNSFGAGAANAYFACGARTEKPRFWSLTCCHFQAAAGKSVQGLQWQQIGGILCLCWAGRYPFQEAGRCQGRALIETKGDLEAIFSREGGSGRLCKMQTRKSPRCWLCMLDGNRKTACANLLAKRLGLA